MASSTAHLLKWKVDMPPEPRGAPRHPNFVNASWRRPGDKIAEKAAFNEALAEFHQNRGTEISSIPKVGGKTLDLHLLYMLVCQQGGIHSLLKKKKGWKHIAAEFDFQEPLYNPGFILRASYLKYLFSYERVNFFGMDDDYRDYTPQHISGKPIEDVADELEAQAAQQAAKRAADVAAKNPEGTSVARPVGDLNLLRYRKHIHDLHVKAATMPPISATTSFQAQDFSKGPAVQVSKRLHANDKAGLSMRQVDQYLNSEDPKLHSEGLLLLLALSKNAEFYITYYDTTLESLVRVFLLLNSAPEQYYASNSTVFNVVPQRSSPMDMVLTIVEILRNLTMNAANQTVLANHMPTLRMLGAILNSKSPNTLHPREAFDALRSADINAISSADLSKLLRQASSSTIASQHAELIEIALETFANLVRFIRLKAKPDQIPPHQNLFFTPTDPDTMDVDGQVIATEGGSIVVKVMPTVLNMFFTVNPQTDACVYYATEFIAHLAANPYSRAVFDELDGALPKTCERLIELVLVEDELGLWAVDALYSIAFNSMQVSLATHVSHGRILYHLMTAFRHYFRQYIANTPEDIRTNEREAFRHGRTDDNHPRHMADRIAAILQRLAAFPETRDSLMPYEAELLAMALNVGSVPHRLQALVSSLQPAAFDLAM